MKDNKKANKGKNCCLSQPWTRKITWIEKRIKRINKKVLLTKWDMVNTM